jgi:hypothetical protein
MKNVALGQEEIPFCALSLLTMTSLRNPWVTEAHESHSRELVPPYDILVCAPLLLWLVREPDKV